jgi:hypothetical protein
MADDNAYSEEEWELLSDEEQAEAIVVDSFRRIERAGIDPDRVEATVAGYVAQGVDPVSALSAAVDGFDHSEATDEMDALSRISSREGWE